MTGLLGLASYDSLGWYRPLSPLLEWAYTPCRLHVAWATLNHVNNKIQSKAFEIMLVFPESACEGFFVKKQPLYISSHPLLCWSTSSHLHTCWSTSSHSHICWSTSSHLHICWSTSSHLHICWSTSSHHHTCWSTSSYPHICSSHPHTCWSTSSHLHICRSTSSHPHICRYHHELNIGILPPVSEMIGVAHDYDYDRRTTAHASPLKGCSCLPWHPGRLMAKK